MMPGAVSAVAMYVVPPRTACSPTIAVMAAGRLHQMGTPHELLNHPADQCVADLMEVPKRQVEATRGQASHLLGPTHGCHWRQSGGPTEGDIRQTFYASGQTSDAKMLPS